MAVSPDGRNLYTGSANGGIGVFARNLRSDRISQLPGAAGCHAPAPVEGCAALRGLAEESLVAVSPDGRHVYALDDDGIAIFSRDPVTGALTQLAGTAGCVNSTGAGGCQFARALKLPVLIAFAPDGRNVYVTAASGTPVDGSPVPSVVGSVVVFARDPDSGALTQFAGQAGCVSDDASEGCADARALSLAGDIAVSADGRNVYVVEQGPTGAVTAFARDPLTGALTQLAGPAGCLNASGGGGEGCSATPVLTGAIGPVELSANGRNAYVGVAPPRTGLDLIAVLARDPQTGALSAAFAGREGCLGAGEFMPCVPGLPPSGVEAIAASPDGERVYVSYSGGFIDPRSNLKDAGRVDVLARDPASGRLRPYLGRDRCITSPPGRASPQCRRGRGLAGAGQLAVAPDGKALYAAAFENGGGAVLSFARPIVSAHRARVSATRRGRASVLVRCHARGARERCKGKLTLHTPTRHANSLKVGARRFMIPAGGQARVLVRIAPRARRLLKRSRQLRVRSTAAASDATGHTHTTRATLTLHHQPRRR